MNDRLNYIHPPVNPTGSIYFPGDNGNAQVMAVPRTIRNFKKGKFTNSYHLNKVMGNFKGIDSMNLTSDILKKKKNMITRRRELLTIHGRPECLNYNDAGGFPAVSQEDVNEAKQMLTADENVKVRKEYMHGASYVSLKEVWMLQKSLKEEPARTITVYRTSDKEGTQRTFISKWPRRLTWVIPAGTIHGEPVQIWNGGKTFQTDKLGCISFYVLNMIHMIPELWITIDCSLQSNRAWQGWILTFLSSQVLRVQNRHVGKDYPFIMQKGKKTLLRRVEDYLKACVSPTTTNDCSF
jgi:hypothetical protein